MGFIDYQGNKEDRFDDVVDYAKAQLEEEIKSIEFQKISKWIADNTGSSKYAELNLEELIKYIIVKYRTLKSYKEKLFIGTVKRIDENVLWSDMCIALVTRRFDDFNLTEVKRNVYYNTFMSKVFKIEDFTIAKHHYNNLIENEKYKRYFEDCFDLVQEKQFWKYLGYIGKKDIDTITKFVDVYNDLSILIGYYLYLGLESNYEQWMQRLEIEKKSLDRIKQKYSKYGYRNPDLNRMCNPLYPVEDISNEVAEQEEKDEVSVSTNVEKKDIDIEIKHSLDIEKFEILLSHISLNDYIEACKLLIQCNLSEEIENLYKEFIIRVNVLRESIDKYKNVYEPDMYSFYEYYIPQALKLTATYTEYLDVKVGEDILKEVEQEVVDDMKILIQAVDDKVDEIYKFASIELKAEAKALGSVMNQDGYVEDSFKIN